MPRETLQQNLQALHAELGATEDLDQELRVLLKQVAEDIEALLENEAQPPGATPAHTLRARLEETTVKFEADYPRLSHILGDLTDTLTKLGV
jgi:hypothetical protein